MIKKAILLSTIILLFGCVDNTPLENCLQILPLNISTDLNNPQLINAQTPGGFAELSGGSKGILLFNINGSDFVAYDKLCPNNDCSSPMIFENGLTLRCSCDDSEYSVHFGGAPQTQGNICPAREYKVTKNGSSIRISNF